MAHSSYTFGLFCSLLFFVSPIAAQASFRPKALVLPVTKDAATLQYVTQVGQRTPLVPVKLTVHLGGNILWVDCEKGYVSSTNRTARCGSAQCNLANAKACGGGICGAGPNNPISNTGTFGDIRIDVLSIQSTNGRNPGRAVTLPNFIFLCGSEFVLQGLASGVTGIAGLGRSKVALPSQLAAAFSFDRKFAVCFSPDSRSNGVIFFGDGPYVLNPDVDASKSLTFTPLFINPVNTESGFLGEPSVEYFVGVKSVRVSGKAIPINTTLLTIDSEGVGGTKISSVNPYTVLETSIHDALVQAFVSALNVSRVAPIAPFGACFNTQDIVFSRLGPSVPQIDLVFQNNNVVWSIVGANSIVRAGSNGDVSCLGFVDGGVRPRTSIVIGGHQLENNLLQFDLATSRLGFSNSLLFQRTTCSNFNFTSA